MNPLRVFFCFARSGGTLLNRCLGCSEDNVVLSEVNPAGAFKPIIEQAEEWFGLITPDEREALARLPYDELVARLDERCVAQGRRLIVRDWTTVNFLPGTTQCGEPSGVLEQLVYLSERFSEVRGIVFTRKAAAVFDSVMSNIPTLSGLTEEAFAEAYLGYARAVTGWPRFQLESFTCDPSGEFRRICDLLDAGFVKEFYERQADFLRCTGDNTLVRRTGAEPKTGIRSVQRTPGREIVSTKARAKLREADALFGYEVG